MENNFCGTLEDENEDDYQTMKQSRAGKISEKEGRIMYIWKSKHIRANIYTS